jgi:hypothetical protein
MTPVNKPVKQPKKPVQLSLDKLIRIRGGGITFPAGDAAAKDAA